MQMPISPLSNLIIGKRKAETIILLMIFPQIALWLPEQVNVRG